VARYVQSIGIQLSSRLLESMFDVRSVQDVGRDQPGWVVMVATTTVAQRIWIRVVVGIHIGIVG